MAAPLNPAEWISAASTAVIAAATILYVIFTRGLWRETKNSAEAAKNSADAAKVAADAAKQSAQMAAESHQPMVEVSGLTPVMDPDLTHGYNEHTAGQLHLQITFKNYGAASAMDFGVNFLAYVNLESDELNRLSEPSRFQISPGAELTLSFTVPMAPPRISQVWGGATLKLKIMADYRPPQTLRMYTYLTVRALDPGHWSFRVLDNLTQYADPKS